MSKLTGPSAAPPPWREREGWMIFAFELLWMLGLLVAWGPGSLAAGAVLWAAGTWLSWPTAAVALPVAYLAFLVGVVAAVGLMGMLLPKPREGTCRVFRDANFFRFRIHWCLERYVPRPLITHIQLLTGLRTIYFRMMGARLSWSTHLSPGCQLWGPSMIRLGHLTYVGDSTHLASHLNQGDKLLVAPIVLGDRCNVGAQVHVGPGCSFGSDVRIGALSDIAPGCWIEDSVELGPCCQLGMGVKIGAGSRIEPRSFLDSWTAVPAGEIWGGDPARKLGDVEQTAGSRRKERRRAGGS